MYPIRSWLIIGRYVDSQDRQLLSSLEIGAILQLAAPVVHPGIETLHIPVEDGLRVPRENIDKALKFVHTQKERGKIVLIACAAAISRSPAFAMASLMNEEALTIFDAYKEIHLKYNEALPHPELFLSIADFFGEKITLLDIQRCIDNSIK